MLNARLVTTIFSECWFARLQLLNVHGAQQSQKRVWNTGPIHPVRLCAGNLFRCSCVHDSQVFGASLESSSHSSSFLPKGLAWEGRVEDYEKAI